MDLEYKIYGERERLCAGSDPESWLEIEPSWESFRRRKISIFSPGNDSWSDPRGLCCHTNPRLTQLPDISLFNTRRMIRIEE